MAIRERPDRKKKWLASYRGPDGKERSKSFERKRDANDWLAIQVANAARGEWIDPRAGKVTFRQFADQWLAMLTVDASTLAQNTSRVRKHMVPMFGDVPMKAINAPMVQQWVRKLSDDLEPSTVAVTLRMMSSIMKAAVESDVVPKNPCASKLVRPPTVDNDRVDPLSVDQVADIITALDGRYRGAALLGAGVGLRQGEAFGVTLDDIDFLGRRVYVRRQVKRLTGAGLVLAPPKGRKTRSVPLADAIAMGLAEHIRRHPPVELTLPWTGKGQAAHTVRLLTVTRLGRPVDHGWFNQRQWKPALAAAGLMTRPPKGQRYGQARELGFHALRHHFASVLLAGGVSIRALADYLGHHDPAFTLRVYAHLIPDDDDRMRHVLDAALADDRDSADHMRTKPD